MKKFAVLLIILFTICSGLASSQTKKILIFDPINEFASQLEGSLNQIYKDSISTTQTLSSEINNYDALFLLLNNNSAPYSLTEQDANLLINYLKSGGNIYVNGSETSQQSIKFWNYISVNSFASLSTVVDVDSLTGIDTTFTKGLVIHKKFQYGGIPVVSGNLEPLLHANGTVGFTAAYKAVSDSFKVVLDLIPYYVNNLDYLTKILNYFNISTISPDYLAWFPLHVGDKWIYKVQNFDHWNPANDEFNGYRYFEVADTITLSDKKTYFQIIQKFVNNAKDTIYLRIDSSNFKVYQYSIDSTGKVKDLLYEDLSACVNDTVHYSNIYSYAPQYVDEILPFSKWGINSSQKNYRSQTSGFVISHSLVKNIGKFNYSAGDITGIAEILIAFKVKGISYGDSLLLGINSNKEIKTPKDFKLSQNYPNPFNPSTTIDFTLPVDSKIVLNVYNSLGQKVAELVNRNIPAGNHSVNFNASKLASGVYVYRLSAENGSKKFVRVKKLVLLK